MSPPSLGVIETSIGRIEEFQNRQAARENGVAGQTATPQHSKTASLHAHDTANPEARSGSLDAPYRRKDNVTTSATTVHLPVGIHKRLRTAAVDRNVHMSKIVAEAVAAWLDAHGA